jgi:LAO/AO transport system kinase
MELSLLGNDPEKLVAQIQAGNTRAGARVMRWVDDRDPRATPVLKKLFMVGGKAQVIGVTGNPGSGKSTLVGRMISHYREKNMSVGVVAVDPSSPFSGGAILGDRIRMQDHFNDPGVFIRSLATRGHLGGLSASTIDTVTIMDAMGFDVVIVETVGVGQDEVEIVRLAETTIVVVVPGLGDEIQALKAGVLEIADIFCINKADRDGADRLERELLGMQEFDHAAGRAFRPMIRTVATKNEGVDELIGHIEAHSEKARTPDTEEAKGARQQAEMRLRTLIEDRLLVSVLRKTRSSGGYQEAIDRIYDRSSDPYTEAEALIGLSLKVTTTPE